MIELAEETIKDVLGEDGSIGNFQNSGGETHYHHAQKLHCKATYLGLGADAVPGFHNPNVVIDTKALEYGVPIWCRLVEKRLGAQYSQTDGPRPRIGIQTCRGRIC